MSSLCEEEGKKRQVGFKNSLSNWEAHLVRRIISNNASSMKKAFELLLTDMKALEQEAAKMKSDEDLHFSDKGNL